MLMAGTLAFGGVIGWAAAFVEPARAGLLYRLAVAVLGVAMLLDVGWMVLAGTAAGMIGHDVFTMLIRRRTG